MGAQNEKHYSEPQPTDEDLVLGPNENPWGLRSVQNKEKGLWFVPWLPEWNHPGLGVVSQVVAQELYKPLHRKKEDAPEAIGAILDTGVLKEHPLLIDRIIDTQDFTGEGPEDRQGHGTHMAIRVALLDPYTRYISIKVKGLNVPPSNEIEHFIKGVRYAINRGVRVISISVGWPIPCKRVPGSEKLCAVIKEAIEEHDIFVSVAGEGLCPAECHSRINVVGLLANEKIVSYKAPTVLVGVFSSKSDEQYRGQRLVTYEQWRQKMEALKATITDPRTATDLLFTGLALQDRGMFKKATKCYSKAFSLDRHVITPDGAPSAALRAAFAEYYNKAPAADLRPPIFYCFDQALAREPKSTEVWTSKGVIASKLRMHELAIQCYDKVISFNEKNAVAWFDKGVSLTALNKSVDAIICYDKSLELDATNDYAWLQKGGELMKSGEFRQAIECFDVAIELNPKMVLAWFNKGEALLALDKSEQAKECNDRALEIDPKFQPALWRRSERTA